MGQINEYEEDYHAEKHEYLCNNSDYYLVRSLIARHDFFGNFLGSKTKVLDFGCGMGNNIYGIKGAVGYDSSKFAVSFCKSKGINATTILKDIKGKFFDIVLSSEVLEHVENPLSTLKLMKKKMKDLGFLILILPVDKWNKPDINDRNQHLYNWNFNTITNLMVRAGLHPINYETMRRTGFYRLLPFCRPMNKLNFKIYLLLTWMAAIFSGSKHIKIIAIKK